MRLCYFVVVLVVLLLFARFVLFVFYSPSCAVLGVVGRFLQVVLEISNDV